MFFVFLTCDSYTCLMIFSINFEFKGTPSFCVDLKCFLNDVQLLRCSLSSWERSHPFSIYHSMEDTGIESEKKINA